MPLKELLITDKAKILKLKRDAEKERDKALLNGNNEKYYVNSGCIIFCDYILNNSKTKKENFQS